MYTVSLNEKKTLNVPYVKLINNNIQTSTFAKKSRVPVLHDQSQHIPLVDK